MEIRGCHGGGKKRRERGARRNYLPNNDRNEPERRLKTGEKKNRRQKPPEKKDAFTKGKSILLRKDQASERIDISYNTQQIMEIVRP